MRVLAINDTDSEGGAAQLFRRTNGLLRKAGHEILSLTAETLEPERFSAGQRHPSSAWGRLRGEFAENVRQITAPRLLASLDRFLQDRKIDVAHVHNVHGRLSAQILPFLKRRGIAVVYQVNDYYFFCNSYVAYNRRLDLPCKRCVHGNVAWAIWYGCVNNLGKPNHLRALVQALKRMALQMTKPWKAVDLFLVTGQKTGELLCEWGVGAKKQRRIFNPMVLGEFDIPTSQGEPIVFYAAYVSNKGTETFLKALEYLEPGCRLGVYLMGMPAAYEQRLREVAQRRRLSLEADSTLRWGSGLRERIANARAIVVPSQWWVTSESVVYEAMLLGKPVIASRIGGNTELIDEGETGFLFEPRNEKELAGYMNRLSADHLLASRMGSEAAKRARERFSETVFVDLLEKAYRDAIALSGGRR
ncbi:MAG: glycosyltransferase family 4 protein [Candidatus Omnitrophica bacterium]|nr:glycosyltransferase family 4 protein [Candidatus Omnitrophota bacterium]